jgi:S-DNA-T family DNA segregation ATPase FtsK/SpoIIIE
LGIATIVNDPSVIGVLGADFARANIKLFGYAAYYYLLTLIIPLLAFYTAKKDSKRYLTITGLYLFPFFMIIVVQALIFSNDHRGTVGGAFVDFLKGYIGGFGIWVVWLMIVAISSMLLLKKSPDYWVRLVKGYKAMGWEFLHTIQANFSVKKSPNIHYSPAEEPYYPSSSAHTLHPPKKTAPMTEPYYDEAIPSPVASPRPVESTILSVAKKFKEEKHHHGIIVDELEENKALLASIDHGVFEQPKDFKLPPTSFLQYPPKKQTFVDERELDDKIRDLIDKLAHFNIEGDVVRTYAGPIVSTFEFKPAANIKVSKILGLQDDLAMALKAQTIRIQAPVPGKDVVGIEIPNRHIDIIYLRDIFESKLFQESASPLTLVLGKDIVGKPFITDLKKLPHLLIAGTTGSGKSVGINGMILSLLYKNSPDQLKLLMIDPKMLEFSVYNDIPHLLTPVITKPKEAIAALSNMVYEMERRYQLMSETRTKNIENFNDKMKTQGGTLLPYIVVIIDELADLMMTSGKDVEYSIARLAQMARASGIHLIVATQRPSVDVVTGLIKANLPSRISYKVGQKIDSKIILDGMGAESLLGRGDMLFTPPGMSGLVRLHAPWSSESEIEKVVDFLKEQRAPQYDRRFLRDKEEIIRDGGGNEDRVLDELYEEAKNIVLTEQKTSISYLQRRLQIGYNRSATIIEQLEQNGILSPPNAKGNRELILK